MYTYNDNNYEATVMNVIYATVAMTYTDNLYCILYTVCIYIYIYIFIYIIMIKYTVYIQ